MTADIRPGSVVPVGGFHTEDEAEWYRIDGYDLLDPFLIALITPTDQWMFVSTSGALTAGRHSAEHALFPYETDDRLHRYGGRVGPVTLIRVDDEVWEPFSMTAAPGVVRRSVSKTAIGDRLRFEETHPGLGLTFRYTWGSSDRLGFVRSCELLRDPGLGSVEVTLVDGFVDVLPSGVPLEVQSTTSTLVDAYRRSEVDASSGMALFTLEAMVADTADPAESLRATAVWSIGLDSPTVALSDRQLSAFRGGHGLRPEHLVKGQKGSYFVSAEGRCGPDAPLRWHVVADVDLDHVSLAERRHGLGSIDGVVVTAELEMTSRALISTVAPADALQEGADREGVVHHFANVLFNSMRGGVFIDEHRVDLSTVEVFVATSNADASGRFSAAVSGLTSPVEIDTLRSAVTGDADLVRLVNEYLPLHFSRRHGDPSRPWNAFSIGSGPHEGGVGYEGNWRDIFQNWEALCQSFPGFIESVVAKFLNASTLDGFNPYRISNHGVDWEVPEEGAWAHLGYWGDHQIAYLHPLLDTARRFHPGLLESHLDSAVFAYADVPYRIAPYPEIVADPKNTITFDADLGARIADRVDRLGSDGRLVPAAAGSGIHHATLAEKLLVPALSKLSNLVAGAGIWMNTQRPEWNDANNALVGNGVSVVTLMYLREYVELVDDLLSGATVDDVAVGSSVATWLEGLRVAFERHSSMLAEPMVSGEARRSLLDDLGTAFSRYREEVYADGPGSPDRVEVSALRAFIATALPFLDHAAAASHRPDGLVESYCLMHLRPGRADLEPLYEMLEGQVAVLAGSTLDAEQAIELVDVMFGSRLYRPDQRTFMLYPNRQLPAFMDKNVVPDALVGDVAAALLDAGEILARDVDGVVRFDAEFSSARPLERRLSELGTRSDALGSAVRSGSKDILDVYEAVFAHAAFTGRSGTMYRYEGLGSVYWHMVSKLLIAVEDQLMKAVDAGEPRSTLRELAVRCQRIRSGLGFAKSVDEQGSFPTDPHSHTPAHTGAQQPGMTGQVKEGVLLRWSQLGVAVEDGRVRFRPVLLEPREFLSEPRPWPLVLDSTLDTGTLAFTYCGVPIVYRLSDRSASRVTMSDGSVVTGGDELDSETSRALFARQGRIRRIDIEVDAGRLLSE